MSRRLFIAPGCGQTACWLLPILSCCFVVTWAEATIAFIPSQRWQVTATGSTGNTGSPITLTWSFVPDGTPITGVGSSGLLGFLDETFGGGSGDLTLRPWFPLFSASLQRWGELSGVTFQFEPDDDGAAHSQLAGELGVRGDIRFAGASLDGFNNTLALSSHPNNADILLDTDDGPLFSNPGVDHLRLRNVLMHELGHSLGFEHLEANNAAFLMEPALSTTFDGPQLDDIRAVQWYYGDAKEKSNGGLGNNSPQLATPLGLITIGESISIGADAGPDLTVAAGETDFVSIHNGQDSDYYAIRVARPSLLDVTLTPRGGVFNQGPQGGSQTPIDANARSDLAIAVFDKNGTSALALVNRDGAGAMETIGDLLLPTAGEYYVRVTGASAQVQLYQLDLSIVSPASSLAGDYNRDGVIDAADYSVWRDALGQQGSELAADGNGDEVVDQFDYAIWKSGFGLAGLGSGAHSIPEPTSLAITCLISAIILRFGKRRPQHRG